MEKQEYYLGLDIGTNSVGWAVTDCNYNIIRKKGKDSWGVRLFEEAKTAEERRVNRSSRRRTQRKKARLDLLREIFEEEICKVDKDFYNKLDESKFYLEDKKIKIKYNLFNDKNFTDKEYFEKYPTIFHLRNELANNKEKNDIRLYFLAINQIMKRRGHFLFEGQKINSISDVTPYIESLDKIFKNEDININLSEEFYSDVLKIILNKNDKKTDKKKYYKDLVKKEQLEKNKESVLIEIGNLIISGKATINKIFVDLDLENLEVDKIDFTKDTFDDEFEKIDEILGERSETILIVKSIYDYVILQGMLDGNNSLSEAQIQRYEKHNLDLKILKDLIKKYDNYDKKLYKVIFTDINSNKNYANYVGSTNRNGKKISLPKSNQSDFYKFLKDNLSKYVKADDEQYLYILNEIELERFLPKQISNINSVIPYQLHLYELNKILDNLKRDYPNFGEIKDGISEIKKIELIFKFRIPYYVGPLNKNENSLNSWIVKNKEFVNEKIRPWNFEKIVDLSASEKEFIKRMTNKCTYLKDKDVLAKNSILYSKFMVFNELNNLKINGAKLSYKLKSLIYEDLFLKYKKVTIKRLRNYLIANNFADGDVEFSGIDIDFKSNMGSFIDIKNILDENYNEEKAEEIIELLTIHTGNKRILQNKIKEIYSNIDEKLIKKLAALKYSDWGRLSKEFLLNIEAIEYETGEVGNILYFLEHNNDNLMQLLSSRYSFSKILFEYDSKFIKSKVDYSMLDELYISPSVKKMVWQSLQIIEEIKKIFGGEPKRIFLEMARSKEDKPERKESRKKQLLSLYKYIKSEKDFSKELESLNDSDLRREKLFLYYTQMGKCMYSGDDIDLDKLWDNTLYDIDHIIPRSLKKDDSALNNKVLVKKDINQRVKKDIYPIPKIIRDKAGNKEFWKSLLDKNLITKIKYDRLIRSAELTNEELAEFINRQLVETRQTTKVVGDLLKQIYKDSTLVYVKAGLVSEFRQNFEIYKERSINNLHHAHDAYLNIVVGNGYYTKFTENPLNFVNENRGNYTLNKIFYKDIKDLKGNIIWNKDKDLEVVRKTVGKNSILITRESYEGRGQLFNASHVSKKDIKKDGFYLPLKKDERLSDIYKYGAYGNIYGAYFCIVEHILKKNKVLSVEFVPIYLINEIEKNGDAALTEYYTNIGLVSPRIIVSKVLMKTEIKVDGFRYTLNGRSNDSLIVQTIEEPYWSQENVKNLKNILSTLEKSKMYNNDLCEKLDRENLINTIEVLLLRISSNPYKYRRNIPTDIFKYDYKKSKLSKYDLVVLIKELLKLITPTLETVNLELIGGRGKAGKATISKNIQKLNEFKIINRSIAGFYINEMDVLKLWDGEQ